MPQHQSVSPFDSVPVSWYESVLGLWVAVLASIGMRLTVSHGGPLLRPLGTEPWAAATVTVFVAAVAYGVFGFGVTRLYRASREFEPRFEHQPFTAETGRWLAGLVAFAVVLWVSRES